VGEAVVLTTPGPVFSRDPGTAAYYERRAAEYDEWYLGAGRFVVADRPGWGAELDLVVGLVRALPPVRTLDVGCGTGFLTRHLRGLTVGLDRSPAMVALARAGLGEGVAVVGDALALPFAAGSLDRVFTGHFYGHLPPAERAGFLAQARRVADELVVVDSALRAGVEPEQCQERVLNDGSRHRVYKRYLRAQQLADEISGEVVHDGTWFVAARTHWRRRAETPSVSPGPG